MSKVVQVPNVGNVEFPDTMSDDDIAAAIRQQLGKQPEPRPPAPYDASGENFDPSSSGANEGFGAYAKQGAKSIHHAAIGAGKGVIGTLYHIGRMTGVVPENKDFEAALDDQNAFQTSGHVAEQAGEFALGEGAANAALKATGAAAKIASAGRAARLAAEVAKGAAVGAGVTKAEGGSAVAGAVAGGAVPVAGAALEPLANSLFESAVKSYSRTLGATKRTLKTVADRVARGYEVAGEEVPGLVDRGVVAWTRKGLSERAATEASNLGDQIDTLWSNLPKDETVPTQDIVDAIDAAKAKYVKEGPPKQVTVALGDVKPNETPVSIDPAKQTAVVMRSDKAVVEPAAVRNLDRVRKLVTALTDDNGEANVHQLHEVKQIMDEVVAAKGGYSGGPLSIADSAGVLARRQGANAIREVLADAHPDIAAVNRQYHFWSQAEQVLNETLSRTSSQSQPMGQQIARVAGAAAGAAGGPAKAILTGEAAGLFRKLTTSAAWNTTSAVAKDRLAKVIASGSTNAATNMMKYMLQAGVSDATQGSTEGKPRSAQPQTSAGAYRRPGAEFPGGYLDDENDAMFMRREDADGNELAFPVPIPPNRLLPAHFKNARNIRWGAPLSGEFPERPTALGKFGADFDHPEAQLGPGAFANTAQVSRAGAEEPATYAHELGHAIFERDLSPEQKQAFTARVRDAAARVETVAAAKDLSLEEAAPLAGVPKAVVQYGGNPHETFAELNAQYMLNPSAYRAKYPDWYAMYKGFYRGKEYITQHKDQQ